MDQKTAAMIIARFFRKVVLWNSFIREEELLDADIDRCDECGVEVPLGFNYCLDCGHSGPCRTCGSEIRFTDWAWTGHCSRACSNVWEHERRF